MLVSTCDYKQSNKPTSYSTKTIIEKHCPWVTNENIECCVPKSCNVLKDMPPWGDENGFDGHCSSDEDCVDGLNIPSTVCSQNGQLDIKCCIPKDSHIGCTDYDINADVMIKGTCIPKSQCDTR
mmetsp:Transcript_35986/g.86630  ORF Transcript_35986/g.86630 Transcript_35986/m.86630 type:complete len:124 (+) Transcript_35986:927-1298(+)